MANQIGSKPKANAMGVNRGTTKYTIPIQSKNIPKIVTVKSISSNTPQASNGIPRTKLFTTSSPPMEAKVDIKVTAPTVMVRIMLVVFKVEVSESARLFRDSLDRKSTRLNS